MIIIGERDALAWILTTERMAFPDYRAREVAALKPGDELVSAQIWWLANLADNRAFARRLGLSRVPRSTLRLCADPRTPVLQAFSPSLVPRPRDWGDNHVVTGFWRLPSTVRSAIDEGLPEDLATWVDAGEPPVFLGFGSMPVLDPEGLLATATEVTRSLGVRAVLNLPRAGDGRVAVNLPEHVTVVGAVNHERLLPRCAAAVHHGGAGTLAASLRPGLPTMVCSVWGDQPFWGARLEQLGAGVHVPFKRPRPRKARVGHASASLRLRARAGCVPGRVDPRRGRRNRARRRAARRVAR